MIRRHNSRPARAWHRALGLCLASALLFGSATPALAQDAAADSGAFEDLDAALGKYVVGPMATVLFFDVLFWDNSLPFGDGVGKVIGGDEVMAYDAESGYTLKKRAEVDASSAAFKGAQIGDKVTHDGVEMEVLAISWETASLRATQAQTRKSPLPNPDNTSFPIIVLWLVAGAIFFTLRMAFINIRGFRHAIDVTRGHFDDEHDTGEVSHFQALSSALSATVGLGNIAGVAVAVAAGGPGAVFWMIVAAFFGMSSKFTECTLGQMYREVDNKGRVLGGPMRYLRYGLEELGYTRLGKVLAVLFAIMCMGGSLGGGNMFQANQAYAAVASIFPDLPAWLFGMVLAVLVGFVIIGGIRRIGAAAGFIVPFMCGIYVLAGLYILLANISALPSAFATIISGAFTPEAGFGGMLGVLVQGFRRAAFSNEAGIGSASIAHSAAATEEPVREGIVALLEPFIDTIIVCTMTGLVVVVTGAYRSGAGDGVLMTSAAFESAISWFPYVLSVAVVLFAFSTMISWSYYGERCWSSLFGSESAIVYRVVFLICVFIGSVIKLSNVLEFSDLMVLGMAFPNILGLFLLSGKVRERLDDYWRRYTSGEMKPSR